jgi:hypothetical protein
VKKQNYRRKKPLPVLAVAVSKPMGTRIPNILALDPKTLPKTRNSEVCNNKTGKTG